MESLPERQQAIGTHTEDMDIGGAYLGEPVLSFGPRSWQVPFLESPAILLALGPNHIH